MNTFFAKTVAFASGNAMETETIQKNGVSPKCLIMSRIYRSFVLSFIALLMAVFMANAQNFDAKDIQFEGVAGLNLSDMGGLGSKVGFHFGVKAETALSSLAEGVYANAGALISFKGNEFFGLTTAANYLEIPVHMGYKHAINDKFAVYGEAGPYLAFGLFGKSDFDLEIEYGDINSSSIIKVSTFGNDGFKLKRFDIGFGFRAGVEIQKKYTVSIGYDLGFIDTYKGSNLSMMDDGYIDLTPKMNNTNFSISAGYKF